jgi:lipoprotein-releasing system permease protein
LILSPFEWTIAKRYLLPGKGEAFIALVASISIGVVMLSVAMLVVVMSVMNGFRAELLDKIVGLNGHAIVQAYGGRMDDWENILEEVRQTPGVVDASPLIEQPLLTSFNGRVEAIIVRGNTDEDIDELASKAVSGNFDALQAGASKVAIGIRLAENIGARVGDTITIINPQGRSTPFGTVPRQVGYEVAAIFEVGVYDYDGAFVVMPMQDAQTLMPTRSAKSSSRSSERSRAGRWLPTGRPSTRHYSRRCRSSARRWPSRSVSWCWWRRSTSSPASSCWCAPRRATLRSCGPWAPRGKA